MEASEPSSPDTAIINSEPPSTAISVDMQDVIEDLNKQISELNYQNTILRLSLKNSRR